MTDTDLGPPRPLPTYLWPQRGVLGPGDLRTVPSTGELRMMARTLERDHLAGQLMVTQRDGSPWLEFDVFVPFHGEARQYVQRELPKPGALAPGGIYRYALWRYTGAVYRVDHEGAVEDDPILTPDA
jgi:hypothetical protein